APRPERAETSAPGAESLPFIDRPDFFDYPDSDQARVLALSQFIGEKPVIFANSGMNGLEHHIRVAALMLAFFFLLFQFCSHM
uniref:Chromosome 16 open reading frame 92 n=1 Tax=Loxodonta africana TaxID=9785 RepID=G3TVB7_LOXAF